MRQSGILMHITSLPGPFGVGTLGDEAGLQLVAAEKKALPEPEIIAEDLGYLTPRQWFDTATPRGGGIRPGLHGSDGGGGGCPGHRPDGYGQRQRPLRDPHGRLAGAGSRGQDEFSGNFIRFQLDMADKR